MLRTIFNKKRKNLKEEVSSICDKCKERKGFLIRIKTLGCFHTSVCLDCMKKSKFKRNRLNILYNV